ncbi:MAG: ABC transporter substrate-binding protein [Actinomycetota bacterium]|nr:ABC transporter substrate-binding protein [Actinomycetota bacterium]
MRMRRSLALVSGVAMAGALAASAAPTSVAAVQQSKASHHIGNVAGTTITLEGPNQWTQSGSSFGRPWNQLVNEFHKLTGVTVKTDVLPLTTFSSVEATQLAAGTAPDLLFKQTTYQPYMVVHLNKYLERPNPFVPGNKKWLSLYKPQAFSASVANTLDAQGNFDWVPFNLVGVAMYYNEKAFQKAGITAPIKTWKNLMTDCALLKKSGYTPIAMDNSNIGFVFPYRAIYPQLMESKLSSLNHFTTTGQVGSAQSINLEDYAWAVATGRFSANLPQVKESLVLLKELYDNCATKNWSGITGLSGDGVGLPQFESGKAAMAFAVDFGYGTMAASAHFPIASMAFPEITTATTKLSKNIPPDGGTSTGGTSYLIPAHTTGNQLKASLLFLQFMASKYIAPWLAKTGGVAAIKGIAPPPQDKAFFTGNWGKPLKINPFSSAGPDVAPGVSSNAAYDGYLLGAKSLGQEVSYLNGLFQQGAGYLVHNDGWSSQSWASSLPGA